MTLDPVAFTAELIRCPSITPSEGGALATRTPAPVPESIRGTRAGEIWQEKIAGTTDEGDVFV